MVQVDGGGNNTRLNGHDRNNGLNRSRCSQCMPSHGFGGTDSQLVGVVTKTCFDGLGLRPVIGLRGGAMSIEVVYLIGTQISLLQGAAHCSYQSCTSWCWISHMVGIAR